MRCNERNNVFTYILHVAIVTIKQGLQVKIKNTFFFTLSFPNEILNDQYVSLKIHVFFLIHVLRNELKTDTLDLLETSKSIKKDKLDIRSSKN